MGTAITPDAYLAALTEQGINWRFYTNKADWLRHNRNAANNNQGWGPLRGAINHNTASDIRESSMLRYLYDGDPGRNLPGPLAGQATAKDGTLWLLGWGASNHAGPGDKDMDALIRKDEAPLNRDFRPDVRMGEPGTVLLAPYYFGNEGMWGAGPTPAQVETIMRWNVACMKLLGYTGGSVGMHREFTTTRSDAVGIKGYELRNEVNRRLKKVIPPEPVPPVDPVKKDPFMSLTIKNPVTGERWIVERAVWSMWTYAIKSWFDATKQPQPQKFFDFDPETPDDFVTNPLTGSAWPIDNALWSLWYYTYYTELALDPAQETPSAAPPATPYVG